MSDEALATIPDEALQVGALLRHALDKGVGVEALEKLVALHERVADRMAAREFAEAMSGFQAECPPIPKSSKAKITTKSGTQYSYTYAELDQIARIVNPILSARGLSYTWDSETDETRVRCSCTLRHINGHSVSASFSAAVDRESRMNHTQQDGAALTYAKRQALVQVLGLTTTDPDTDAHVGSTDTITDKQAADLGALIDEVKADAARFLSYLGVDSLDKIRAVDFSRAVKALESKRRAK